MSLIGDSILLVDSRGQALASGGLLFVQVAGTSSFSVSQFPAAAALADGAANPTTTTVGNVALVRNGAGTLDRHRSALAASGTTGTGIPAYSPAVFDGSLFWPVRGNASGAVYVMGPVRRSESADNVHPMLIGGADGNGAIQRCGTFLSTSDTSWTLTGFQLLATGAGLYTRGPSNWERLPTTLQASGSTGTGIPSTNMVFDGALFWPQRGNASGAAYVMGPVPSNESVAGINPLLIGAQGGGGSSTVQLCAISSYSSDARTASSMRNLEVNSYPGIINAAGTADRVRSSPGASGATGTGLLGVSTLIQAPNGLYFPDRSTIGTHANAWNAANVSASGVSNAIDCEGNSVISIFGNAVGAATTITVLYSADGVNFYDSVDTITVGLDSNFGKTFSIGAKFVRLRANGALNPLTATVMARR